MAAGTREHTEFLLNTRKLFLLGVVNHWPTGETVESPSAEIFITRLDVVLDSLPQLTLLEPGGLD